MRYTEIRLDPGLAFGTGTHETTRLCLEYLDSVDLQGKVVIDYGCGSGILGIAAGLLGAATVYGIDNDVQAITATNENAARNNVEIISSLPFAREFQPADLIVANILAQPLVELKPELMGLTKPGGLLVLSGIMTSQSEWVESAYADQLALVDRHELNGWMRLVWRK